jgi:hypothetical protein
MRNLNKGYALKYDGHKSAFQPGIHADNAAANDTDP